MPDISTIKVIIPQAEVIRISVTEAPTVSIVTFRDFPSANFVQKQPSYPTPDTINDIIACLQAASLCALIFLAFVLPSSGADFGDISRHLAMPAGTSVRRNAGNTDFEAYTPSAGVTAFIGLSDVPNSYVGEGLKGVRVNVAENALEFYTITGGGTWGSITGTLSDQTDLQTALDTKVPAAALTGEVTTTAGSLATTIDRTTNFTWTGRHSFIRSVGNTVSPAINTQFGLNSTGTPGAGFGSYNSLLLENSISDNKEAAQFVWLWTDPTNGAENSAVDIWVRNNGTISRAARFWGSQSLSIGGSATDPGAGVIEADTGFKIGTTEFPIASNGLVERIGANSYQAAQFPHSVTLVVDGGGIVLGAGTKNPVKIPYGGTLQGWVMMCSPSGSVTADILRAADGAGLPVTSIVGGSGVKPAIATNVENSSTSFTNWTSTTLTAKDNLAISLSGISTATYCQVTLYFK